MAKKSGGDAVADLAVAFGTVSINVATAKIGAVIGKKVITTGRAEKLLCGHRLTCQLVLQHDDEAKDGQKHLGFDDEQLILDGVADVKSISLKPESYGISLTFSKADVDVGTLSLFCKGHGRLIIREVAAIPVEERAAADSSSQGEEQDEELDLDWRAFDLIEFFDLGLCQTCKKAGMKNLGEVIEQLKADGFEGKRGIGRATKAKIIERLHSFAEDNPHLALEL